MTKRESSSARIAGLEARVQQLEEELREAQKLEAVAKLAGSVAHDFNNLLTTIKGLSTLALKDLDPSHPVRADLAEIERAAQRAADLTRQLLSAARDPAQTLHGAETTDEHGSTDPTREDATGPTILVAEDDPSIRRLVDRVLGTAGYRVLCAEDAPSALALAEQENGRMDLLLTDVIMPRMSGHDLWTEVERRWSGVRVLYMSGYTDNPVVRREAENPAGAFLAKPFAPEALLAAVRRTLDREP